MDSSMLVDWLSGIGLVAEKVFAALLYPSFVDIARDCDFVQSSVLAEAYCIQLDLPGMYARSDAKTIF